MSAPRNLNGFKSQIVRLRLLQSKLEYNREIFLSQHEADYQLYNSLAEVKSAYAAEYAEKNDFYIKQLQISPAESHLAQIKQWNAWYQQFRQKQLKFNQQFSHLHKTIKVPLDEIELCIHTNQKKLASLSAESALFTKQIAFFSWQQKANMTRHFFSSLQKGDLETAEKLLKSGANINAFDVNGYSPLMLAIKNQNLLCVEWLLKNNADPNLPIYKIRGEKGFTPLIAAVVWAPTNIKLIDLLLNYGANITAQDSQGFTALHAAVHNGSELAVAYLMSKGEGEGLKILDHQGRSPLDILKHHKKSNPRVYSSILKILNRYKSHVSCKIS